MCSCKYVAFGYNGPMTKTGGDNFRTMLSQRGFKVTKPRLLVLEILTKTNKPISPHEIHEKTKGKINRASVYRVLEILVASELVRRIDFRHNHPHYEFNKHDDHHHIICLSCGFSEEIDCKISNLETSLLKKSKRFKEIKDHSLEFYGYCSKCS